MRASAPAFPGRSFAGKVASIDSRVDMNTRSVIVRALLANEDGALKPGMFLNVSSRMTNATALVIPEEALTPEAERQYVFVVADGKVSRREVRIGGRQPGTVEVARRPQCRRARGGRRHAEGSRRRHRDGASSARSKRSPDDDGGKSHEASAGGGSPASIAQ